MNPIQYSNAISIHPRKGQYLKFGGQLAGHPMERGEAKSFLQRAKKALNDLKKLPAGRRLIDAINASGKTVKIYCAYGNDNNTGNKLGGCALPIDPSSVVQNVNRMAIPFLPMHRLLANTQIRADQALLDDFKDELQSPNTLLVNNLVSTELARVMMRASETYHNPWIRCGNITGIPFEDLLKMAKGQKICTANHYLNIGLAFYNFLSPGLGCDTQVRLLPEIKLDSDNNYKFYQNKYERDGSAVRADIMLGHELIHAWRMMTGRRLVSSGFEEEMMTVGLGPCFGWEFTENKLRQLAGHPIRTKYPATASTDYGGNLKNIVEIMDSQVTNQYSGNIFGNELKRSLSVINRDITWMLANNQLPNIQLN